MIPFNKPNLFGNEIEYILDAYENGKISGDGKYTKLCENFLEKRIGAKRVLLTTSGTHALEMSALLLNIKEGDEVIMPSYTFVSTANAFVLRGAKIVYCDIREDNLNMNEELIEDLITPNTRVIVPVHYAGMPCNMDKIMQIADKYNLLVVEDAAQAINSKYKGRYLGTIGDVGCYSFHETKNLYMGEGGALILNKEEFVERAEIMREKGTNRKKFFRGEVDKYSWVDIGSSYAPSDILAAILWAQFERIDDILNRRKQIWKKYYSKLKPLEDEGLIKLPPNVPDEQNNAHIFYILTRTPDERDKMLQYLKGRGVNATFHYVPLHLSKFSIERFGYKKLPVTEYVSERIIRLPLFYSLSEEEQDRVISAVYEYFNIRSTKV